MGKRRRGHRPPGKGGIATSDGSGGSAMEFPGTRVVAVRKHAITYAEERAKHAYLRSWTERLRAAELIVREALIFRRASA